MFVVNGTIILLYGMIDVFDRGIPCFFYFSRHFDRSLGSSSGDNLKLELNKNSYININDDLLDDLTLDSNLPLYYVVDLQALEARDSRFC